MRFQTMQDFYTHELRDLLNAETQLEKAMPKMIDKAHSPRLKNALKNHLSETKEQRSRLENLLKDLGADGKREPCEAMQGIIKEAEDVLGADGEPEVIDAALISMGNRVEHYEMAGYGSARTHAEMLGLREHAKTLQQSLDEEGAADKTLTQIAKETNKAACGCG